MEKDFSFGKLCLAALFVFGESALYIPYTNAGNGVLVSLVIAALSGTLLYFFWYFSASRFFELKKKSISLYVYCLVLSGAAVFVSGLTAFGFIKYLSKEILIKSPRFFLVLILAALVFFAVKCGEKALSKFSVLTFVFCVLCIIIMFAVSSRNFNKEYLSDAVKGSLGDIFGQGLTVFVKVFLDTAVFAAFSRFAFSGKGLKYDVWGIVIGSILIALCLINGVLTFSLKTATELKFAYSYSIGVISVGNLFTRMDGFTYFVFFFSCLVKTAICGITLKLMLNKMGVKRAGATAGFITFGAILLTYLI